MNATDELKRPIRIGNCSGFYGDRATAMAEMAAAGGIDVLTGDYLAEVTMLILGKAKAKDPSKGYATTFLSHLESALESLVENRIRVVVNAGGLNPAGLAEATRELLQSLGHDLKVSHVEGDDVFSRLDALQSEGNLMQHLITDAPLATWPHKPLTANAYLGGFGIARALRKGADIVITGRVADASLVVGPAAWWWNWTTDDYDSLAGAVAAGHVIECGTQATGGNVSAFQSIKNLTHPGFPIAEIQEDGTSVITKNEGTGGAVTADTVTAQLLYEIGDPAYLNSDVTTHLDTLELTDLGEDRVRISAVRGSAPPRTTKVAITAIGGWENTSILALTGLDLDAKATLVEKAVQQYAAESAGLDALSIDRVGVAGSNPATQTAGTTMLRVTVQGTQDAAGRAFSSRLVELALASYPGLYFLNPPQIGSAFGVFWPAVLEQRRVLHQVFHHDGEVDAIEFVDRGATFATESPTRPNTAADDEQFSDLVEADLGRVVHARSGDKGGDANLGVWGRDAGAWDWLRMSLTTEELRRLLPEARELEIDRYELPNLGAINFVIRGLLGGGSTSTLRLDSQAKALGEWLRSRRIDVPRALVD